MANYVLLERIELNATTATVTFSNIPQSGYTDLKIVVSGRSSDSGVVGNGLLWFNGDNSSFSYKRIYGDGTSTGSSGASSSNINLLYNGDGSTANTFSTSELYIHNYASTSTYKSWSVDSVQETNATESYSYLVAGLWSNTSAINSVTLGPWAGLGLLKYSTFSLYGLAASGTTPAIAPKASGGNIQTDGTYWYHTFLSSGTFTPTVSLSCDYLVVAGGGGGGYDGGGGGGAGGLRSTVTATGGGGSLGSALSLTATSYTVTVGAGGTGAATNVKGSNGNDSIFSSITSTGGGGGGSDATAAGASGGSGGGARGNRGAAAGGSGTSSQGYAGGSAGDLTGGGGGGGAGAVGQNGTSTFVTGNGGAGVAISAFASATGTGVSNYYAGGGGAGAGGSETLGAGGAGGGGSGGTGTATAPTAGTANTGGGGGGGKGSSGLGGAAGASGIVIIRYPMAN